MPTEVVNNVYANYGLFGLIVFSFFVLVYWVIKTSKEREEKLYSIIDTLSCELPEIRKNLEELNKTIKGVIK